MRRLAAVAVLALALSAPARAAEPLDQPGAKVSLPGIRYEVLAAGPAGGVHPTRGDVVAMRYVGRLEDGAVFSTSPGEGAEPSNFPVREVIPGMSAALQLMRPGDRWRVTMPAYLAYGPGRPFTPPAASGAANGAVQKRSIPPDATLVFDVELVTILPPKGR
jgi:FKBP-type peptidyl-prolyl cis-trans isomerase